jgi:prevent-host-death family protein
MKDPLPDMPTITDLRSEPGEYLRAVSRHGRSFTITKVGKPVARLVPVDDSTVIHPDGRVQGPVPLTALMPKEVRNGGY